jgi:uncharacterized membrane protein
MRARLNLWIDQLRTGFWFLPLLMLFLAAGLAFVLVSVDRRFDPGLKSSISWAYSGGPEGARSLLSTIAGSMITAASVTFSLASVALSIASQQYGSRVLRNFMRDRVTQVLLGIFISTFIYSVLVVRAIEGTGASQGFVPSVSVTVAIALTLLSLILLIFFVHHISTSIKASHILLVISNDLCSAIPRLFPSTAGEEYPGRIDRDALARQPCVAVNNPASGYVQSIDLDALFALAKRRSAVVEALIKPGDYHVQQAEVARVWGADSLSDEDCHAVGEAFLIGGERTPFQDIRYQFQQLTEVIVRALSPGINDPFTAVTGIDQLASGLAALARRPRAAEGRQDPDGKLRAILPVPDIAEILANTVGHIAIYAASDPIVMAGLRRVLDTVAPDLQGEAELSALHRLREQVSRVNRSAESNPV